MERATKVFLTGRLGQLFGREWDLFVSSPAEALRAIDVNVKGKLREYLIKQGGDKYYKIALQKRNNLIDKEEIANKSGHSDIYIMPVIRGSNSGAGKIIAGVVLLAVAWWNPLGWGSFTVGVLGSMGVSLVLGGITQLLTPTPKNNNSEQLQSFNFQGNATAVQQGVPVPIVYGKALVNPTPICVSYTSYTPSTTQTNSVGNVQITPLPGGGYQYTSVTSS